MEVSTRFPVSESKVTTPLNVSIFVSRVLPVDARLVVREVMSPSFEVICVCSVWPVVTKFEVRLDRSLSLLVIWV